jgi:uncharacterized protein (DUF1697 family)
VSTDRRRVALLRGINVGKAKRVAMSDLKALVEGLGHTDVRTHLNSGNVVFTAAPRSGKDEAVAASITKAIHDSLGLDVDVVVRTRAEVAAVLERDPLGDVATDRSRYLVVFLSGAPSAAAVKAIDPAAYEPERFAVHGRELYLWAPDGVHKARLPKVYEAFGVVATGRNWNTVARLLELLEE